jgi:hypothetical protein
MIYDTKQVLAMLFYMTDDKQGRDLEEFLTECEAIAEIYMLGL